MCSEEGPKKVQGVVGGGEGMGGEFKEKSIKESVKVFSGIGVGVQTKIVQQQSGRE